MFKLVKEIWNIDEVEFWSGGKDTFEDIEKHGLVDELHDLILELDKDYWTSTELNDFLWFDRDFIYENLGMDIEE